MGDFQASSDSPLAARARDVLTSLFLTPRRLDSLVAHSRTSSDAGLSVTSPLTQTTLATLPRSTPRDVSEACARARAAQQRWERVPVRERCRFLPRLVDALDRHHDALVDLVCLENGKARSHAQDEVIDASLNASFLAAHGPAALAPTRRRGAIPGVTKVVTERHPEGVVGIIAPWNYPFTLALSDALAALVAGNAVVLKPATLTPLSALAARRLLLGSGLDPDLFQVVTGSGTETGSALIESVDHVMFTGSTAAGASVGAQAGARLCAFSAELGGKNPLIVLPGAPLAASVRGIVAACFASSGQLCVSIERIYIHAAEWERVVPRLVRAVGELRVQADLDWEADMGPLVSVDHMREVHAHVADAVAEGARVLVGGHPLPDVAPSAYAPTLLTDVPPTARLYREETFGPVVALTRVESVDEAVAAANDTAYGLNAAVWGPAREAERVAARLRAGSVNINDGYTATWASTAAPLGGWGRSGIGCRHGREGLLAFTRTRTIARSRVWPLTAPVGFSHRRWARLMRVFAALKRKGPLA
ncbi:aldehyde dehydrogenase family protein [Nanchangia anserum]|uniref:Aldehyde dehydrogenase family protein n=1 Tax=Nanchangia anserum TaxID=2692125 RepID=A0A8I0G8A7_9ACTO|nr:succinic semialdehyde dehydrogenase [Nanchangia anserum]MBD3689702.1 aldehyde dehydrogenase family protein [Nanchangia anserum]QOX81876.1 aldehyde dehydrogenase family protein [Nanchangia anserum]